MIIETLTDTAAAICLESGELRERNDSPSRLCAIVRQAQAARGLSLWQSMEAEVFVRGDRVLLLARPVETVCFLFPDFETLLGAALACPPETSSALTYLDGRWLLQVTCPPGRSPAALGEFGCRVGGDPALAAHLAEHGQCLISRRAVARLQDYFCLQRP